VIEVIDPDVNKRTPRVMVCPFCGHESESYGIGSVHCGPHKLTGGYYHPAVRMIERDSVVLT
jgi:hypothetical protein